MSKQYFIIFCILLGHTAGASEISFESDVKIKRLKENAFSEMKSGSSMELAAGESLVVITPRGLPVILHSPSSSRSKTVITDSNMESLVEEKTQPSIEKSTNDIIDGIRKAEVLIQKKDYAQARSLVNDLKRRYPRISSILFMSGTIHYLMNNRPSAIEDLESGLQIDSKNESARKLLAQMRGTP